MKTIWLLLAALALPTAATAHPASDIATQAVSRMAEPWWHARFVEKQHELAQGPVDLLWIGDSITQNWERDGPLPQARYLPVWQHYYGGRHAVDLGFKGDSTCHLLWRIDHGELDGIAPRAAIVLIGANNFGHVHTDADQTYNGIVAVLDRIHARLPQTRVLLLAVLPSIRSDWVSHNTQVLDQRLDRTITQGRPWLRERDLGGLFRRDGRVDPAFYLDPNLTPPAPPLHPSADSMARIAGAIEPDVAAMLNDRIRGQSVPNPP